MTNDEISFKRSVVVVMVLVLLLKWLLPDSIRSSPPNNNQMLIHPGHVTVHHNFRIRQNSKALPTLVKTVNSTSCLQIVPNYQFRTFDFLATKLEKACYMHVKLKNPKFEAWQAECLQNFCFCLLLKKKLTMECIFFISTV